MTNNIDVTDLVEFKLNDDEFLPITKCVCGQSFKTWDFIISMDKVSYSQCENCGRKFFFTASIRVFEVPTEAIKPLPLRK